MSERWLPVADWPYEVSSLGRIRRTKRAKGSSVRALSPVMRPDGHVAVTLRDAPRYHTTLLHRVICEAFHGPAPADKAEVRHLNGIADDNRADNLCWGTRQENAADMVAHGTSLRGERSPHALLNEELVREIRKEPSYKGCLDSLVTRLGVPKGCIKHARYGQRWEHVK